MNTGKANTLLSTREKGRHKITPPNNYVHRLTGYGKERKGERFMECHVAPDWLLIWVQKDDAMILVFTNTGSHAELF